MPLDLSALEETCSLLVPAYGITHAAHAVRESLEAFRCVGPVSGPDDTFGPLRRDEWHLQPRGTAQFMFGASALFNEAVGPQGERRIIRLREARESLPDDLANTCLMVEGARTCARKRQDRSDIVPGYAAWAQTSSRHAWISNVCRAEPGGRLTGKTVWFGRAGWGALYAPVGDGRERILLLDFHIADREETSPDLLFVFASCTEVKEGGIPHLDPRGERLGDDWNALIEKAKTGFQSDGGP